jgi:PDZ domain-containing protein
VLPGLLVVALIASFTVYLPYYAYTPGSATDTEHVIKIKGAEAYPANGEIDYTTVRIKHLTPWRAFQAWRDPAIDVVSEKAYLGNLTPSANKTFNLQLMSDSKQAAVYVALTRLGYKIPVTGGGAVVREVSPDVPAASVLKEGDVIVAVDGTPVHLDSDLGPILEPHKPGDEVTLTIERPTGTADPTVKPTYNTITEKVKLAARDDGTALIGIAPGTRDDVKFDFPVNVDIDSGSVGGPSAGLAFTLGVIDALTRRAHRRPEGGDDRHDQPRRLSRADRRHQAEGRHGRAGRCEGVPGAGFRGRRCRCRGQRRPQDRAGRERRRRLKASPHRRQRRRPRVDRCVRRIASASAHPARRLL